VDTSTSDHFHARAALPRTTRPTASDQHDRPQLAITNNFLLLQSLPRCSSCDKGHA
jgi:hypothetical protein